MDDCPRPCFFCGYDLRGVPGDALCPECGKRQIDEREVTDYRAVGLRQTRWRAMATVIFGVCVLIGVPLLLLRCSP